MNSKPVIVARVLLLGLLAASAASFARYQSLADVVIKNGTIVDGSGNPGYRANLAIRDGKIIEISRQPMSGKHEIDARGMIVAPGFIDVHTHAENVLEFRDAENFVRMGVTSVVIGNCGGSEDNIESLFQKLNADPASINVATLIGHNTVRRNAMGGNLNRVPTPSELNKMKADVDRAMQSGAVGLSTGLIYLPGTFSKSDEIIELAKVVSKYDGIYASHMRSESTNIDSAIDELLTVAKSADCRAELSHIKLGGEHMWGKHGQILAKLEEARAEGIEVTQDQYVYTASSTSLSALIEDKYLDGGLSAFRDRLKDASVKTAVIADLKANLARRKRTDYAYVVIANYGSDKSLNGKNLVEATQAKLGKSDLDSQIDLMLTIVTNGNASCVFHGMDEGDIVGFMKHPNTMFASDSSVREPNSGVPHPRGYGNNARVLQRYVRELKHLRLEDAIRKMTSLPAQTFRLKDRGLIKEGMAADLVVFDPAKVEEKTTYTDPHHYAVGFRSVLVNGTEVVRTDSHTKARPGKPLYRAGFKGKL